MCSGSFHWVISITLEEIRRRNTKFYRPGEEGGVSSPDEGIYETNFIWSISIRWFQKSMLYGRNRYHRASISCLNLVFDGKLTFREIGNLMGFQINYWLLITKIEVMKYNSAPLSLVLRIKPRFHAQNSFFPETFKIIDFRSLISKIDAIYQNSVSVNPYSISKPSFQQK